MEDAVLQRRSYGSLLKCFYIGSITAGQDNVRKIVNISNGTLFRGLYREVATELKIRAITRTVASQKSRGRTAYD